MSQYPYRDPGQIVAPLPYQSWPIQSAPTRPAAISGMAWTGISIGIIWALLAISGAIGNAVMLANNGVNPFMPSLPKAEPIVVKIGFAQSLVSLPFATVLLVGCIGALKLRPGARRTMMVWSFAAILLAIATMVTQIIWVLPASDVMMRKIQPNNPGLGIASAMAVPATIIGGLLHATLPTLFLILWSRPHVKAAFGMSIPTPPPGYPPA